MLCSACSSPSSEASLSPKVSVSRASSCTRGGAGGWQGAGTGRQQQRPGCFFRLGLEIVHITSLHIHWSDLLYVALLTEKEDGKCHPEGKGRMCEQRARLSHSAGNRLYTPAAVFIIFWREMGILDSIHLF